MHDSFVFKEKVPKNIANINLYGADFPESQLMQYSVTDIKAVLLEWTYTPKNYLEEPISILFDGGTLQIKQGNASATIDPQAYQADAAIREQLTGKIESRLLSVQIMTHRKFELSKASRTDIRKDGKKHHYLEVDSVVQNTTMESVDGVVKDKDGNIVSDTKRERLEEREWYATLIEKFRFSDTTLDQMLQSYQASTSDPDNELVHLYEIRDSLASKFGSKKSAVSQLNISNKQWDVIGELANHSPLKQGRHRGRSAGTLRDAEVAELEEAEKSVGLLIEKYLEYLGVNHSH